MPLKVTKRPPWLPEGSVGKLTQIRGTGGMTQWQNWVTVLESGRGPSYLMPETWVQICDPHPPLQFEKPKDQQGAQNSPKLTCLRAEGSPPQVQLSPLSQSCPPAPSPSLSLLFVPLCLSLSFWMSEAPGPHCKLSNRREPRDRNSESKPHTFIKQQDFEFDFHPIQIRHFLPSTGSLTSECMFSKCNLYKEEGARGALGVAGATGIGAPLACAVAHGDNSCLVKGLPPPGSPSPRAMATSGTSVSLHPRAPSPEPGFTGPARGSMQPPDTRQGARLKARARIPTHRRRGQVLPRDSPGALESEHMVGADLALGQPRFPACLAHSPHCSRGPRRRVPASTKAPSFPGPALLRRHPHLVKTSLPTTPRVGFHTKKGAPLCCGCTSQRAGIHPFPAPL